jgi:hypothetical protein
MLAEDLRQAGRRETMPADLAKRSGEFSVRKAAQNFLPDNSSEDNLTALM